MLAAAGLSVGLSGCVVGEFVNYASHVGSGHFERLNKQRDLERVARDWCLAIRASQVIPVYPLDEDVQVGDVFVVDTPIDKLKKYWNSRGYLPIDHRFGRFQPTGYSKYYLGQAYGVTEKSVLPAMWQSSRTPDKWVSEPSAFPTIPVQKAGETDAAFKTRQEQLLLSTNWPLAPRVGFPSYSFKVRAGEGFNGALPLQGVPVMLGALGARSVTGSVSLSDAYTYGIDESTLREDLYRWSIQPKIKGHLSGYEIPPDDKRFGKQWNYVRVVTRVYLLRSVQVSLVNQDSSAWRLSAGAPKQSADTAAEAVVLQKKETDLQQALSVALANQSLAATDPAAAAEVKNVPAAAIKLAEERAAMKDKYGGFVLPGGTVSVSSATERSISMNESFARPIVIGYHALEFPIGEDGALDLARPVSSFSRMDYLKVPFTKE
ncbi:MAG: hypothetical protein WAW39_11040 [Prosthecobacter sp.]|uniref:hypothetical protein n=1 Tax=Prosthecobacter sp. TaxID=1965333 RepID=UPI003BB02392